MTRQPLHSQQGHDEDLEMSSSSPQRIQLYNNHNNGDPSTTVITISHGGPHPQDRHTALKKSSSSSYTNQNKNNSRRRGRPAADWIHEHDQEQELMMLPVALAYRSYHLPGYGCCADWFQYFCNTHPLFGLCCHHKQHPVKFPMRLLHLIGSIVFGLLVTTLVWLWLMDQETVDANRPLVTISVGGGDDNHNNSTSTTASAFESTSGSSSSSVHHEYPQQEAAAAAAAEDDSNPNDTTTTLQVTEGMIVLWTVGGIVHALYDTMVWYLAACVCCLPGRSFEALQGWKPYSRVLLTIAVTVVAAVCSFLVLLRASWSDSNQDPQWHDSAGLWDDHVPQPWNGFEDKSSFDFLVSYGMEVALALFVWYPIVGTILFSGVLGCGRVPILGGRPYEMMVRQEQERQRRYERAQQEDELRQRGSRRPPNQHSWNRSTP